MPRSCGAVWSRATGSEGSAAWLSLARLRAGGELVEVRAGDLRFTLEEVAAYVNDEAGERTGSVNDILVLQAHTDHARGDVPGALAALERALTLAEPSTPSSA